MYFYLKAMKSNYGPALLNVENEVLYAVLCRDCITVCIHCNVRSMCVNVSMVSPIFIINVLRNIFIMTMAD